MWPFDRWMNADVLRVCRDSVEHWADGPGGLVLRRHEPLAAAMDASALQDAIGRLFADASHPRRVDAVIESAWLPVMLLAPGPEHRRVSDLEALLRKRVAALHDLDDASIAQWQVQIDGLPGQARVCGYALPVALRAAVTRATAAAGVAVRSLQPAWAWARAHASQRATRAHSGWWLWQESDRTLVANLFQGRVRSLHPAIAPMNERFDLTAIIGAEAVRHGLAATSAVVMSGWVAPTLVAKPARWLGVAAMQPMSRPTLATTAAATVPAQGRP